jgi:O-antigen/teichoic acid export membrane protein
MNTTTVNEKQAIGSERRHEAWDIKNIFKNYFFLAGYQIGSALFAFCIAWVATAHFGAGGYGGIIAILSASQVVLVLINWTSVALVRHGVEEFVVSGSIRNNFLNRAVILIPNLVLLIATSPFWLPPILSWLKLGKEVIPFIILYFIVTAIWLHVQSGLQAAKLLRLQGLLLLVERLIILLSLIIIAVWGRASWLYATLSYVIAALMMAIIGIIKLRPYISFSAKISRKVIRKILAFSLPLFPYTVTGFFSTNYLDAFFISKYLTKADLGIYSIAYQVSGVFMQFPMLVGSLLLPLFVTLITNKRETVVNTYLQEILPVLTLLWGVLSVCFAVGCCLVLPKIFGKDFIQANQVIWVLVVGSTVIFPSFVGYSPFVTAAAAVFISFPLALITAATNVSGNSLLIPGWGLLGSAWATVLSYLTSLFVMIWFIHRRFVFQHKWLFQSIIPSLISIVFFSWRGNLWESFFVSLLAALLIYLFYRRSITTAIQKAIYFRNSFRSSNVYL